MSTEDITLTVKTLARELADEQLAHINANLDESYRFADLTAYLTHVVVNLAENTRIRGEAAKIEVVDMSDLR